MVAIYRERSATRSVRRSWQTSIAAGIALTIAFGFTLFTYSGSLTTGFMFDDPLDLPRATRSFVEVFTDAGESSYYRPIVLAIWKAIYVLLGRHDPVVLHVLDLAVHGLNTWLVYQLGRRLTGNSVGLVAAALFAWFPFSFQVVGTVNAFFHAVVTMWLLAAVLLYWDGRLAPPGLGAKVRLGLALAAGALGLFSHENGLVGVALVVLTELALRLTGRSRAWSRAPVLFAGISIAFLVVWSVVPRWRAALTLDTDSLRSNSLFFVQGLVYPVAGQIDRLPRLGSDNQMLLLAAAATFACLGFLALVRARGITLCVGLGWFVAGALPASVLLSWDYVKDGPRLLYPASVGIALVWAAALAPGGRRPASTAAPGRPEERRDAVAERRSLPDSELPPVWSLAGNLVGFALVVLLLIWSARFILRRIDMQAEGAAVVAQLVETATRPGPEAGRVYANLPSWLAPRGQGFLLGSTGVVMIPFYIGLGRSVYVHQGEQPAITSLGYPAIAREWDHHYGVHGSPAGDDELERVFRQGGGIYSTRFAPGRLDLLYVGRLTTEPGSPQAAVARFGDWAVLERAEVWRDRDDLVVDLDWRALRLAPADYTVLVHLVGASPKPIGQADGYPIGGMFAVRRWQTGDRIHDRRYIPAPVGGPDQEWSVLVGLYDRTTGARAAATDAAGHRFPDDAAPIGAGNPSGTGP